MATTDMAFVVTTITGDCHLESRLVVAQWVVVTTANIGGTGKFRQRQLLPGIYCCFSVTMMTVASGAWRRIVAKEKGNQVEAVASPVVALVGQINVGMISVLLFLPLSSPVGNLAAIFW